MSRPSSLNAAPASPLNLSTKPGLSQVLYRVRSHSSLPLPTCFHASCRCRPSGWRRFPCPRSYPRHNRSGARIIEQVLTPHSPVGPWRWFDNRWFVFKEDLTKPDSGGLLSTTQCAAKSVLPTDRVSGLLTASFLGVIVLVIPGGFRELIILCPRCSNKLIRKKGFKLEEGFVPKNMPRSCLFGSRSVYS
jgi:hypothetical protein